MTNSGGGSGEKPAREPGRNLVDEGSAKRMILDLPAKDRGAILRAGLEKPGASAAALAAYYGINESDLAFYLADKDLPPPERSAVWNENAVAWEIIARLFEQGVGLTETVAALKEAGFADQGDGTPINEDYLRKFLYRTVGGFTFSDPKNSDAVKEKIRARADAALKASGMPFTKDESAIIRRTVSGFEKKLWQEDPLAFAVMREAMAASYPVSDIPGIFSGLGYVSPKLGEGITLASLVGFFKYKYGSKGASRAAIKDVLDRNLAGAPADVLEQAKRIVAKLPPPSRRIFDSDSENREEENGS